MKMKMVLKKSFVMIGLIGLAFVGVFIMAQSSFQKEVATQPGLALDINLKSGGNMIIKGWEQNKVTVKAEFSNGDQNNWNIDVKKLSTGISVKSEFIGKKHKNNGSITFAFMVPKKYDLKLDSMGGTITIMGVEGNFSGKTMGGDIKGNQLKGVIEMKTMGGEISLTDSDLDGKVKTMGGRVMLENIMGDVSGSSMGGNVIYKNVKSRSGNSSGEVVNISTMGGDINVSEATHGAKIQTMGGDIHVISAKEFIVAKTMGGTITVEDISGWIKAETMGGDVAVTMTGNPKIGKRDVTLSSMGGNITLTVPAELSMSVDITLAYTKNSRQNYKITSDFDLQQNKTDTWDNSKGTPRKYIYGKGNINGGTHKIYIKTINGNVTLKKK